MTDGDRETQDVSAPKGRALIFTGDGKGKTTAALGTALRAVGQGMRVLVVQFVKCRWCGEHEAAKNLAGMMEIRLTGTGFLPEGDEQAAAGAAKAREALAMARQALSGAEYGLVVLDEVLVALAKGLLDGGEVRQAVEGRARGVHVILTGRGPWEQFADVADTITLMECVKHGHQQGVRATKGLEF